MEKRLIAICEYKSGYLKPTVRTVYLKSRQLIAASSGGSDMSEEGGPEGEDW